MTMIKLVKPADSRIPAELRDQLCAGENLQAHKVAYQAGLSALKVFPIASSSFAFKVKDSDRWWIANDTFTEFKQVSVPLSNAWNVAQFCQFVGHARRFYEDAFCAGVQAIETVSCEGK
ncbi:TPA: hypothetical protein ACOJPC_003150 [Vibrio fluvialis]|uniref:hypothetical protein n=1 Tax=Vibrio fluvialis TaxID=676 RepID=UPI002380A9A4|nr:hypothetical protein [Vibrio fluvialis]WDY54301.1 hypothetical protein PUN47_20850 [Vibrio fluvialis]